MQLAESDGARRTVAGNGLGVCTEASWITSILRAGVNVARVCQIDPAGASAILAPMGFLRRIFDRDHVLDRSSTAPGINRSLRATTASGASFDDPSEDLLFELLSDIERGDEEFMIVERSSDPSGQTYAQTFRGEQGWAIEHRDGSAGRHFRTTIADLESTHRILTSWAFDLDDWRTTVPWARVSV